MQLKSAGVRNGSVRFQKAVSPTPETKETNGNVTIVNKAQPGEPARFDITFMIETVFEGDGLEVGNIFHWDVSIPETDQFAAYRAVEDRAARLIAPMLRSAADKIEADLPEFPPTSAPQPAD